MTKVVAIVGMAGSGKSEVSQIFEDHGYTKIRFGDITDEAMKKQGLPRNETSERLCRESLRKEFGMAAYAILNQPRIDQALKQFNVVADGLYSWEEFLSFKEHYGRQFFVLAVSASPQTRYARLLCRTIRPLNDQEAVSRDRSEIENLNKAGPIAMADFTILNESTLENLQHQAEKILEILNLKD